MSAKYGKRKPNPSSPNAVKKLKHIRRGLAIFLVASSPYWRVRWWHPSEQRYIVKSTKETSRIEAMEAAEELINSYVAKAPKIERKHMFDYYAKSLDQSNILHAKPSTMKNDRTCLFNEKTGLVAHFGKKLVQDISASDIRDYVINLDNDRAKPLTRGAKVKYLTTLKKVFVMAAEEGVISHIPTFPKLKEPINARVTFTDAEFKKLLETIQTIADRDDTVVASRKIDMQMYHMVSFLVNSFMRPTRTELLALRNRDITEHDEPKALHLSIHGKTGERISVTMPMAVDDWKAQIKLTGRGQPNDFVFYPDDLDRDALVTRVIKMFNKILDEGGLKFNKDGKPRSLYSCRHYALQSRLAKSGGRVNIYSLAKNSGTSVEMLQKFYAKHMALTPDMIENLHYETESEYVQFADIGKVKKRNR